MNRRRAGAWTAGALGFAVLVNLPNLLYPLFEDTALFALVGHWMNRGLLPYQDLVDQKPPLLYLLMALGTAIFGTSDVALRLFELVFVVATAAATGALAGFARVRGAQAWTTALTGVLLSALLWRLPDRGQVEVYQSAFAALGVWLLVRWLAEDDWTIALAGAALAATAWLKPQGALLPVLLTIAFAVLTRRRALRMAGGLALGAAVPSATLVGWMAYKGILAAFWTVLFRWNAGYLAQMPSPSLSTTLLHSAPYHLPAWLWAALWLGAGVALMAVRGRVAVALAGWAVAAFLQFFAGRYLFDYHKIVMIPPLACALGIGVALAADRLRVLRFVAPLALAVPLLSSSYRGDWADLGRWAVGLTSLTDQHNQRGAEGRYFDWMTQVQLGKYVAAHTAPGDTVQVLGRAAVFYLVSGRRPATRFLITSAAFDPRRPSRAAIRALLIGDLKRREPRYVLVRTRDAFPWFGLPSADRLLACDPALQAWLASRYQKEPSPVGDFIVLRHKEDPR